MYAQFALEDGRVEEAISLSRECAEQADAIGWTWWVSGQRTYLAGLALETGDLDAAEREARAALVIGREHENRPRSAAAISRLAQAAFARGEIERAGVLWGGGRVRAHAHTDALRSPVVRRPPRYRNEPEVQRGDRTGTAADALGCRRGSAWRARAAPDLVVETSRPPVEHRAPAVFIGA